ncbi:unnamed protein product, partial [Allacma fusca]
ILKSEIKQESTHWLRKPKNYPQGPPSLPFVGALPMLALAGDFGMVSKLIQYGDKFGKIFSLDLGSLRCVVINSSALIKEAFGNAATSGRPRLKTFKALTGGNFRGIALQDGPGWKEHRERFSHDDPKLLRLVSIISKATSARRHFMDVYFEELDNRKSDLRSSFSGKIGEENLTSALVDLFFAGSDTSSTTLSWTCLYLALHPKTQKKVKTEIDEVMGTNLPSLDHRKRMPYTEAVILESLRCSSVTQIGIARRVLEDFEVGGYVIPKDTLVFSNIYAAHHDPDVWDDPHRFKPERFLSSDEKHVVKHNAFVAFSYGKRSCPGETLAKDQVFIFLTSILQRFVVALDPLEKVPTMNAKFSTTRSPVPHRLILEDCRI